MEKRRDARGRVLREGESQRDDGRYMFRWTDANGTRHTIYSWKLVETDRLPPGKRDGPALRTREQTIRRDIEDGIHTGKECTLDQAVDRYLALRQDLRPSTVVSYRDLYNHHVKPRIGNMPISKLYASDYKKLTQKIEEEDGIKRSSTQKIMSVIIGALDVSVDDCLIRCNFARNATKFSKKADSTTKDALTASQQEALIRFVYASPLYARWGPLITVFLGTGLRIGELLGLRADDVDFDNGLINVTHTLMYKPLKDKHCEYSIGEPKTPAGLRVVPMLQDVRSALLSEIQNSSRMNSSFTVDGYTNFIFLNNAGKVFSSGAINEALNRIVAAYNREEYFNAENEIRDPVFLPHISPHTFRHTFVTRITEINTLPIKYVQQILGHLSPRTTLGIYSHAHREPVIEAFQEIEGKLVLR